MTAAHLFYIPMMITVGVVVGFFLGGRAARDAFAMQKIKDERRAAAKVAREARGKAAPAEGPKSEDPEAPKAS